MRITVATGIYPPEIGGPATYASHLANAKLKLPDYWRFTHEGLELLFSRFAETRIFRAGGAAFVLRAFTPAPINRLLFSRPLMPLANALDRMSLRRQATNMFMVLAKK